jgi:6-phosphogluconate dehydrogenase
LSAANEMPYHQNAPLCQFRHWSCRGAKGSTSLTAFVKSLSKPRAVWLMVPAAAVGSVIVSLTPLLEPGDILVDGGNSYYHDDIRHTPLV